MDTAQPHQKIAVTGASGFVGRYLVKELLAAGRQVVAVVRNPNKVPELKRTGIELRVADLADTKAMSKAFADCDAVIANAGQVSFNRDYDALIRQNLNGTKNTLQACKEASIARVVAMSSASVYQKIFLITASMKQHHCAAHKTNVIASVFIPFPKPWQNKKRGRWHAPNHYNSPRCALMLFLALLTNTLFHIGLTGCCAGPLLRPTPPV